MPHRSGSQRTAPPTGLAPKRFSVPPGLVAMAQAVTFRMFLGTAAVACVAVTVGIRLPAGWRWLEGVALTIAALATLLTLTPRLPLQNVLAIGLTLYLTSAMALSVGTRWGFLLGKFQFTDALGPRLLGLVPWPVPFLWVALVLASRQTAKVMLRPWRREKAYGWVLFGISTLLVLLQAAVLDPFGHRVTRWWVWTDTPPSLNWAGAPLTLFSDCAALTVVLLLVATAWLIPKRQTGSIPSFEPVAIWLAFLLCFALGNLRAGIWLPGAVGVASLALVSWLAWRGRQFSFSPAGASADAPA